MRRDSPDPRDLVRGYRNAQPGAADEEAAVCLTVLDEFGAGDGGMRVGGFVGRGVYADICDGGDERVVLEGGFDGFFVGLAGFVAGHDDAEGLEVGHFVV